MFLLYQIIDSEKITNYGTLKDNMEHSNSFVGSCFVENWVHVTWITLM